jgi:hypothetical protein
MTAQLCVMVPPGTVLNWESTAAAKEGLLCFCNVVQKNSNSHAIEGIGTVLHVVCASLIRRRMAQVQTATTAHVHGS